MSKEEFFDENIKRWRAFWPEQVALWLLAVEQMKKNLETTQAVSNLVPLDFEPGIISSETEVLYIYGFGSGELGSTLQEWLKGSPKRQLVLIEDDPLVFYKFFKSEQASRLLHHPQIWIGFTSTLEKEPHSLEDICTYFFDLKSQTLFYTSYAVNKPSRCREVAAWIDLYQQIMQGRENEFRGNSNGVYDNLAANLPTLSRASQGTKMRGFFEGVPAIVCGAGPSLDRQIPLLRKARSKALIFAGGSALNALNAYYLLPHFAIATDPNRYFFSRQLMSEAYETPILYNLRVNRHALELHLGDLIYLGGDNAHYFIRQILNEIGINRSLSLQGWSVVTIGVSVACALGCDPIIIVGSDLAYSMNRSYSRGVRRHPLTDASTFITKHPYEELINTTDIHGNLIQTHYRWKTESLWYRYCLDNYPERTLWNATEGGIGLKDVPNLTLEEALSYLHPLPRDLDGMVNAAIEMAQMPAEVTEQRLVDYMKSCITGLKDCQKVLQREGLRYRRLYEMCENEQLPELSDLELRDCPSLANDDTYHHYLSLFNSHFLLRNRSILRRLEIDGKNLSSLGRSRFSYEIVLRRYHELFHLATTHLRILNRTIQQYEKRQQLLAEGSSSQSTLIKDFADEATYSFVDHHLKIKDASLGIDWEDPTDFKQRIEPITRSYASDAIKQEAYLLGGKLHGPSSFYYRDGTLLSKRWYIHGKVEGRAQLYYKTGELKSSQSYLHSKWEGIQYFYYKDGCLRSELPYRFGKLDGVVKIYTPQGLLKHEVSFRDGLREGPEYFWDDQHHLVFETFFEEDHPVGVSRQWHPNGQLAMEFIYNEEGKLKESSRWNPDGKLLEEHEGKPKDYFDAVAEQSRNLSESLKNIADYLPFLLKFKGYDHQKISSLKTEIEQLQKDIESLKKHTDDLQAAATHSLSEGQEAIWKSPSMQRMIHRQLEAHLKPLREKLKDLTDLLLAFRSSDQSPL